MNRNMAMAAVIVAGTGLLGFASKGMAAECHPYGTRAVAKSKDDAKQQAKHDLKAEAKKEHGKLTTFTEDCVPSPPDGFVCRIHGTICPKKD